MSGVDQQAPLEIVRSSPGLAEYLEAVEQRLGELLAGERPLEQAAAQTLQAGGKRLRPLLVFLCSSPEKPAPVSAGVAVELVHLASLVHDDLLDEAVLRRGAPSIWSKFGQPLALACGDALFALAFSELAREGDSAALNALAEAALALAEGEALQRELRFDPDTSVESQLKLCSLKTGSLFAAACRFGAGDAGGSLAEYGLALGIAFQIVDDVLDCSGAASETGKAAGTDLREGIPTLPLLFAAERDEAVRAALAGGSCEGVLERIAGTGALERALEIAHEYALGACAHLSADSRTPELRALAEAVMERRG